MKAIAVASLVLCINLTAFASEEATAEQPLLTRINTSGYVPPDSAVYSKCELFTDRVVVTLAVANASTVEERPVSLTGSLAELIEKASQGPFEVQIAPTDGPATI